MNEIAEEEEGIAKEGLIECIKESIVCLSQNDLEIVKHLINECL